MGKFTMTHDIDADVERFWKAVLQPEFNAKLYEALEFPEYKVLEHEETDDEIRWKVKATPKMDAPGPVAKVLGSSFGYTENSRFDKKKRVYEFKITPTTLADKMKNEGSMRVEPAGDGKCKRIVEVLAEAKIFGVGGMIESSLEKTFRASWQKSAEFTNKWLKEHP